MATTKTIQSLERAFAILELYHGNKQEFDLKEIAKLLALHKSTAFGLVNSLTQLGYLMQNPENQKYGLGLKVLSLTDALERSHILIRYVHPYLERLSSAFQETVHSALPEHDSVVYLDKVEAHSSIYIHTQMGTHNPMHCTGVGKALLAYLSQPQLEEFLKKPLIARTSSTITDPKRLCRELEQIRLVGYALDNEETEIGLSCVAVPVLSRPDTAAFAISVSGPSGRIQAKKEQGLIQALQKTGAQLSCALYGLGAGN